MTRHVQVRIYLGLHREGLANTPSLVKWRRSRAKSIIEQSYTAGTFYDAKGLWNGEREPTLVFERMESDFGGSARMTARAVARELAIAFGQHSVMVTVQPIEVEFITP